MPIWYLVLSQDRASLMYPIWSLIKCISCNLEDIHLKDLYTKEVEPLHQTMPGASLTVMVVHREPENPFREKAEEKEK